MLDQYQSAAKSATCPAPATSSRSAAGHEKPAYYGQQKTGFGAWVPLRFATPPEVDARGRLKRPAGIGPVIRQFGADDNGQKRYCLPIPRELMHLTLDQLHAVLSPDGKLAATHKGAAS